MRKFTFILLLSGLLGCLSGTITFAQNDTLPFATGIDQLTIWNGSEYVPFFVKGVNLGVAVPGTFPGEMAASRKQYGEWFQQIKAAGFNNIRLYTLHYPRFYQVLDSFNLQNPQNPLLFFQGVWLEEEAEGYSGNLFDLTDLLEGEMEENIDCVHGNRVIPPRFGKAYGIYDTDVSKWNMGYIVGREIQPYEVLTTDLQNQGITSQGGAHFAISDATPTEVWLTARLDHLVAYEKLMYATQRPVGISSWPTLDPMLHPEEENRWEDTTSVNMAKVQLVNAPAGMFINYHAYPYYPDFISKQSSYQNYFDDYGPNSYLGYLMELKQHYQGFPLIIAEYGVPSSWGVAHYASSGMNHGGFDENSQGETNIRLLHTIEQSGCGGGIQFAWIDEWFKRTWITDPFDFNPDSRILWHNVAAAEQNFGLMKFSKSSQLDNLHTFGPNALIQQINVGANYAFFEMELILKNPLAIPDEMWIALDTYANTLGESLLPNGESLNHRAEFALHLTNYTAQLYVTEAYDLFGIWHNISLPQQIYRSTVTDGAPWKIVRWKNNSGYSDIQYVGNLQVNHDFQPPSSKDAVVIADDKITVRIPWSYLNVVVPAQMKVFHDYRNTPEVEDTLSDGFALTVNYQGDNYETTARYSWPLWNSVAAGDAPQQAKRSYHIMKNRLHEFNTPAMAMADSFHLAGPMFPSLIPEDDGVLKNDFDLDGESMQAVLMQSPANGQLNLTANGAFTYMPVGAFNGSEKFYYALFDGYSLSQPVAVNLRVTDNFAAIDEVTIGKLPDVRCYPNPVTELLKIRSDVAFDGVMLFDSTGKIVQQQEVKRKRAQLNVAALPQGNYLLVLRYNERLISRKIIITSS